MKMLSERLKWAIAEEEKRRGETMRPADLARAAKTSNTSVTYWLTDVNGIGASKARLLGDYLHVNPLWLETGQGTPELIGPQKKEGLSAALEMKAETAAELQLLTVYRLANERERRAIDEIISDTRELIGMRTGHKTKLTG